MKVELAVLSSPSLIVLIGLSGRKATFNRLRERDVNLDQLVAHDRQHVTLGNGT